MDKLLELYKKHKEIVNYLIVGGLTTVVSLATYYGLTFTVLDPKKSVQLQVANIISWIAAVVFAYFTNRKFYVAQNTEIYLVKDAVLKLSSTNASDLQGGCNFYLADGAKIITDAELVLNNGENKLIDYLKNNLQKY